MDLVFVGLCSSRVRSLASSTGWWQRWQVSPYLVDAETSVGVRVRSVTSIGYLHILVVGVFIEGNNLLAFDMVISTSFFVCSIARSGISNTLFRLVNDCKLAFPREFLQTMFSQWILDLVGSGECVLRSSKPCMARVFTGIPFLCCHFSAFFNL